MKHHAIMRPLLALALGALIAAPQAIADGSAAADSRDRQLQQESRSSSRQASPRSSARSSQRSARSSSPRSSSSRSARSSGSSARSQRSSGRSAQRSSSGSRSSRQATAPRSSSRPQARAQQRQSRPSRQATAPRSSSRPQARAQQRQSRPRQAPSRQAAPRQERRAAPASPRSSSRTRSRVESTPISRSASPRAERPRTVRQQRTGGRVESTPIARTERRASPRSRSVTQTRTVTQTRIDSGSTSARSPEARGLGRTRGQAINREDSRNPITLEGSGGRQNRAPQATSTSVTRSRGSSYDDRYRYRRGRGYGSFGYGYGGYGYGRGFEYGGFRRGFRTPFFSSFNRRYFSPFYSYYGSFSFCYPYWLYPSVYLQVSNYDGGAYGGGYYGSGGAYYGGDSSAYRSPGRGVGALDTDVSPEDAQIFIDGRPVGQADDFDGFPDKLWLEEGTYDVAIYHPGYKTIFRQYTIYPGQVIDIEDRMTRGEALHPDDHGPTTTARRDARIAQDREQARLADRQNRASGGERAASGRLLLDIWPSDAAVYLDGNFLGTAAEVSQLSAGLVVTVGEHSLEVTRPGFETRSVVVRVGEEERQELVIELER
ncbi:MAG: PEGA domain-containing protein [Acidobacteriota bacterium]